MELFSSQSFLPIVVRKYYFQGLHNSLSTEPGLFSPRSASYKFYPSSQAFVTSADVLSVYHPRSPAHQDHVQFYGRVHLNYLSRVFAILTTFQLERAPGENFVPLISGMPSDWEIVGLVSSSNEEYVRLGDQERCGGSSIKHGLQPYGLAVEIPLPTSNILSLVHPASIRINDDHVRHFSLIFTDKNLNSHPAPSIPLPFNSFISDSIIPQYASAITPFIDPPIPNHTCPKWLHDIYVIKNRNGVDAEVTDEPPYWRTWHPQIDSMYWCYFDHEHGSNPSTTYRPQFSYTAYKNNVENESHEGFKIITVPQTDGRIVVMTVHMHVSSARRILQRFHTIIFTVLSANGEIEMEISMKSDFGPAFLYSIYGRMPINEEQKKIEDELTLSLLGGDRIFNVLNIDNDFPSSVNYTFLYKGDILKGPSAISNGLYEQWSTTLKSCSGPNTAHAGHFIFDIRDPSTALRSQTSDLTDEDLQTLNGQGLKRIMMIRGDDITIGQWRCDPKIRRRRDKNGVFWTDPKFRRIKKFERGTANVRQIVKRGMKRIVFKQGLLRAGDPWNGWYDYDARPGLEHIEMGTLKLRN